MKKKLIILGSGESGTGAALLGRRLGYDVWVSDKGLIKAEYKTQLDAEGILWEEGDHDMDRVLSADLVIKSPGIPEKSPVILAVRERNIEVIGEIEFAWRHAGPCTIVAITGSNGKTTTTHLIWHLLHGAFDRVRMGGNVGFSFARMIAEDYDSGQIDENRIFVLEISSFQLDDCAGFQPDIALLLNITPDHLDRYDYQLSHYIASKFRIALWQEPEDVLIYNGDDPNIRQYLDAHSGATSARKIAIDSEGLQNQRFTLEDRVYDLSGAPLKGPHNMFNAACATRVALLMGMQPEAIASSLRSFGPPPHRLEQVSVKRGVSYVNDSKATNVDSVFYALQAVEAPVVWIVGGQDKGNDYSPLRKWVMQKVKAIVCMGLDNAKLLKEYGDLNIPMVEARTGAKEAVEKAAALAESGDTVLLSPACASFDLFKNYEDRGDQFKAAVKNLS